MLRLTRDQVREIDRRSIEEYHIPGIVLMENAAIGATNVALELLAGTRDPSALILCGGGNNGGDGLAVARHLHNHGVRVSLALTIDPTTYKGDALINWNIVQAMKLPRQKAEPAMIATTKTTLIIDAIFGTGLNSAPRKPFPQIVEAIARNGAPVLAIDLPSGLNCDTGKPPGACVRATRTVTFVAEKVGFAEPGARELLGDVMVVSIGCPYELISQL
jgi:NAD(P)H-hydrate epimerase